MPVLMTDKVSVRGPAHFYQGDTLTQIVWFTVNRYHDGVDLAQLAWSIHIENAEGTPDVAVPFETPDVRGDKIIIGWLVRGIATAAVGDLTFNLRGVGKDKDGNAIVWNSGNEKRPVYAALECEPSGEQKEKLSELDTLIEFVGNQLPKLMEDARKAPIIGENSNWWLWDFDLGKYVDSGKPSRGENADSSIAEEVDPTVPAWAKEPTKPTYTAAEVGAIADASGVLESRHYGANSINSTKLADDTVWPRHISEMTWNEVDKRIDAALEDVGGGSGTPGEAGEDGGYYTPTVASDGTLIWTASKSDMPTIPSANIKGPAGKDGSDGAKGDKGDKGDTGATGPKGDTGATGPAGADGKDGAAGTSVTVKSVSESSADGGSNVITFSDGKTITIKNGSKGSTGATGETGPKGDQGPAGSDGAKGDKGDKGDTGATGATGATGPAGSDGVGIKSVTQTTTSSADGGSNIITVTKTDNTTSTFTVKNGSKGSTGATGATGPAGYTPVKGTDYWTTADRQQMVSDVLAALPVAEEVTF